MDDLLTDPLVTTALNDWYDRQQQQWLEAIAIPESPEALALAQAQADWESKRDYYHHAYLNTERY
jgi:hypothetical protein